MSDDYKKLIYFFTALLFLFFLSVFQASFLNPSYWGFNVFLILILFFVMVKQYNKAFFIALIGGLFSDLSRFSYFGASAMALIFLVLILITARQKIFFTLTSGSVLLLSVMAIVFYRLLQWVINGGAAILSHGAFESFSFYFWSSGILTELIVTSASLFIIFKVTENMKYRI